MQKINIVGLRNGHGAENDNITSHVLTAFHRNLLKRETFYWKRQNLHSLLWKCSLGWRSNYVEQVYVRLITGSDLRATGRIVKIIPKLLNAFSVAII